MLAATPRFSGNLSAVPYADDPDGLACNAIEKAVWGHDDLTVREIREFRKDTTGLGKPLQPA
jgi:hypothetical protein